MTTGIGRYAFAIIPTEPLFSKVIDASQQIAELYRNDNIIDRDEFPPHVSLHICTMPRIAAEELEPQLRRKGGVGLFPPLELAEIKKGSSGYVNLGVRRTPPLLALHEFVLELALEARHEMEDDPRPHGRPVGGPEHSRYERYGNAYVLDAYDPHFSIAKVGRQDQDEAYEIACDVLDGLKVSRISAVEFCEIGMRNEVWEPIVSLRPEGRRAGEGT